ncbi:MAG: mannose-1-phosphate guanylyltransferase, partial [Pseudohongiellaceae bacterium]
MIIPVVMAGGSGTRLWPLSRATYPKQFLALAGKDTLLQATVNRLFALNVAAPLTICNEEHRFVVAEQLRAIGKLGDIILEPEGRNTAPAVALAAKVALHSSDDKDPLLLVLAADHIIQNEEAFVHAVKQAVPLAERGKLVTFGIVPESAHTGYGYIRRGDSLVDEGGEASYVVKQFVEKPDKMTAEGYKDSGEYYWNSGMFLFKASRYLSELEKHRPDIALACEQSLSETTKDLDFIRINKEPFLACPDESIDYAVMEVTDDAVVVPLDAGWNDIGAWSALWDIGDKDEQGNVVCGDAILKDSTNCLVQGGERLVTTIGLNNVVIVDTKDALMVAERSSVQDVKKIVEQLNAEGRSEGRIHREVYRPWGTYDSVDEGVRYQVKRITVKPGA